MQQQNQNETSEERLKALRGAVIFTTHRFKIGGGKAKSTNAAGGKKKLDREKVLLIIFGVLAVAYVLFFTNLVPMGNQGDDLTPEQRKQIQEMVDAAKKSPSPAPPKPH